MEMLALVRHPMSNMRLFLNERPQTTLQFPISPRVHKIPAPEKASSIPGVYSIQKLRVQSTEPLRVKHHYHLSIKKEPDHWPQN